MDCPKRSAVASDLPEDPLVEILARVPARSLCRSKCVAKAWRDVIEDPLHRKKLPQTLQGFFSISRSVVFGVHIGYASLLARSAPPQIDPSLSALSFLTELPRFKRLAFSDSCNGLFLFEDSLLGYVVCNPTTKQWVVVPRYGPPHSSMHYRGPAMYLVFDPAVSSHFHLVQFVWGWLEFEEEGFVVDDDDDNSNEDEEFSTSVNVYPSEIGRWNHIESDNSDECEEEFSTSVNVYSSESGQWNHIETSGWYRRNLEELLHLGSMCAVLNGMLHFIISDNNDNQQIVAIDVTRKIIPVPITAGTKRSLEHGYVAQSQGCLHYITKAVDAQLSVWVLEDYGTQKWVLKHSVSFMELFGQMSRQSCAGSKNDYSVVAMHPDGNVVFIVQDWNQKLVSYDMDHKLVSVIGTLENDTSTIHVVPYVPCFLESPALTNKL